MKYRLKLTIVLTTLVSILFSVGSSILIHRSYMTSLDREEQDAVQNIQMLTSLIQLSYEGSGDSGDERLLKTLRKQGTYQTSSDVFLLYKDKRIIYGNMYSKEVNLNINEISENLSADDDIYIYYKMGEKELEYIVGASKITIDNEEYIICACRSIEFISDMRQRMRQIYRIAFLIMLVTTVIVSWVISTILVRPLSRLTRGTREIAGGNLSYRTGLTTFDEVGELSRNFDKMAEELEGNVTLLEKSAAEKDRFMGAFAHEVKTPMTSIIGYAEILRTQELEPEDKEDALNYIYSEAKRLENMSFKLLQLFVADKESLDLKPASPEDIVKDIVVHLTPSLEEQDISIECSTEPGLVRLEVDLVRTLILNLVDNARKAMDKKGLIRIEQRMTESGVEFAIIDNGKGMPKEAIEHITEAFYRVDKARSRAQGGAGLGLSIVAKVVELHNGKIDFESELGEGTTVTVQLNVDKVEE